MGTGVDFGQVVVSAAGNGTTVAISLNAAGLAALNAALGGTIAFGGGLPSLGVAGAQYVFGFSTADFIPVDVRRLDLAIDAVPEPASLVLFTIGLAGTVARYRRRASR